MLNHLDGFCRHIQILEALSPASVHAYRAKVAEFHSWLMQKGLSTDVTQISRREVEEYLKHLYLELGNKNITRFTKLTALSQFARYLIYERVITADFTANIPRPKLRKKLMLTFNKDEVLRFFRQVDIGTEKGIRDVCILILAAFCGLRMNEIITLDLNSIVDDSKDIDIRVKGKQGHDREVILWKVPGMFMRQYLLIRISQGAKGSDPFLVSYRKGKGGAQGNRLTAVALDVLIKQLAKKAGIRKAEVHIHMFRATHANDLQHIKGYTLPAIQERLGWKDLSTAGRYLVRRERIHREYNSLHEYWIEFSKCWTKEGADDSSTRNVDNGGQSIA